MPVTHRYHARDLGRRMCDAACRGDTHAIVEVLLRFGRGDDARVEAALARMAATWHRQRKAGRGRASPIQ